ncbi:MAG: hypothetical protein HYW48_06020 [Deltaproteobacteria bacterium]|nr:hypothetical protein [Deltaproteobacteria bacterium]
MGCSDALPLNLQAKGVSVAGLTLACSDTSASPINLCSFNKKVDDFLSGGFPIGSLIEWGVPMGKEGRQLLFPFLANVTQGRQFPPSFVLWVNGFKELKVFPPAWFVRGVVPGKVLFAQSCDVLHDLKQVFLSPVFKVIVLDTPQYLSREDCLFLKKKAQRHKQILFLLRPYRLNNEKGNVACSVRMNIWRDQQKDTLVAHVIKGLTDRKLFLEEPAAQFPPNHLLATDGEVRKSNACLHSFGM